MWLKASKLQKKSRGNKELDNMAYKQRLAKLEKDYKHHFNEIIQLIKKGAYYDELDERQKKEYLEYKESLGAGATDIALAYLQVAFDEGTEEEAYHFKLSKREKPPTKEELAERIKEVERFFLDLE